MADYAIGDIQGCYDPLMRLLDQIDFDEKQDRLWFVGDLVNRGPDSLKVLRFIKKLPLTPCITLGNHDLHLLAALFTNSTWHNEDDTLTQVLQAEDGEALGHWLRNQSLLVFDASLNVVMTHAGIAPQWTLFQSMALAHELETVLRSTQYQDFLLNMYGNEPALWSDDLTGWSRYRSIANYFTRMRFCNIHGALELSYKGTIEQAPLGIMPWFDVPDRPLIEADILFGHWAALRGQSNQPHIYALDTGCFWGGHLTALRLQDKKRFSI